jgi:hypothetical protein
VRISRARSHGSRPVADVTILLGDRVVTVTGEVEGERLWLEPGELGKAGGWAWTPEGLCRGMLCVPVPARAEWVQAAAAGARLDLTGLARHLGQPVAASPEHGVWSIGEAAEEVGDRLRSLEAPDFTLPDLDGHQHRLSAFRGRKVFLLFWASW